MSRHRVSAHTAPAARGVACRAAPWIALSFVLLSACSTPRRGGYYEDDGPPARSARKIEAIADAVPRREPYSPSGNRPYTVFNKTYRPLTDIAGYRERGVASWYGKKFHGRRTSSGEAYDMYAMTAAHKTLPIPCYARVRNLRDGREVVVRVNDRGPFLENRLIDLSYAAATRLGIVAGGTGLVEVTAIPIGPDGNEVASARPVAQNVAATAAPALYIQLGAFATAANAEQLRAQFARAGFADVRVHRGGDAGLYHVRIGPLDSVAASDDALARAQRVGAGAAYLVIE